jgi:hypothetical protein
MHSQDPLSRADDQFAIDVSAFLLESVPDTGIKLVRPRPETQAALATQLQIPHRLELLRRRAASTPAHGSSRTDTHFVQDVAPVGQTSLDETVYLVLSVIVEPSQWQGGWWLAVVPPHESERFAAYLASAREAGVAQLKYRAEAQP